MKLHNLDVNLLFKYEKKIIMVKYINLLICSLILISSCTSSVKNNDIVRYVVVDTIGYENDVPMRKYPGKVISSQDINVSFRVPGVIQKIYVKEGETVSSGKLLASLDATDYKVQLDAVQAEYNQIKSEADRVIALYQENGTTPNMYDKAVYGLEQITAKLNHAKDQMSYTSLYAPFNGVIQTIYFDAHEAVASGMPVISIVGVSSPEVEINIPSAEYANKRNYDNCVAIIDAMGKEIYELTFIGVSPKANANNLYTLRFKIEPSNGKLPSPGMAAIVNISENVNRSDGSMIIKSDAIINDGEQSVIFVYNPIDSCICSKAVKIVKLTSDGSAIIESENVEAGDIVVTAGVNYLKDNMKVKPINKSSKTNVGGLL